MERNGTASSKLLKTATITAHSSSLSIRTHGGRFNHLSRRILEAFVPEGYPSSVTPDYMPFQIWDLLQGLSTYVRTMLSTQALLSAIGVGEKSATVIGATFQWFLRDLTGMLGGVLFTFYQLSISKCPILSNCVKPVVHAETNPVVLLHGFDSSCLEWRYTLPLLEDARLETWAIDILGWGFSDLVGPSLGAAVAIDFVINHPEAVDKLVLIDASVYAEGTGNLSKLPKALAYAAVYLLKSVPLRFYATSLTFNGIPFDTCLDWTNIARLHCLLPWLEDMTVDFMNSAGYNVSAYINQVKQKTLIIWGEDDQIIDNKLAVVSTFLSSVLIYWNWNLNKRNK